MAYLKPGIFLLVLFAFHAIPQVEMCYVQNWDSTSTLVRWCDTGDRYTNYTVDARPVGPVVDAYNGPQDVFGCETMLRNLCPGQEYEVTVTNGHNETSCNFTTYHGELENIEPSELQVQEVTSTSVSFIWKHVRCFRRDGTMFYMIESVSAGNWSTDEDRSWGGNSWNETHDHFNKTGLTPGRRYRFTFNTCSSYHCSSYQHSRDIWTTATANATTPSKPRRLKVESITSESFQISWSEPLDAVDGYMVYLDDRYTIFPWNTTWTAENLDSDTDYVVSVAAFNMDRENKLYSENVTVGIRTIQSELNPPRFLRLTTLDSNSFALSWEHPSNTFLVEGYRVTMDYNVYWLNELTNWFYGYRLRANTQYRVEVAAYGHGRFSSPLQTIVWTREKRYNPPRNLTITSMDSSHFEIAWSPPDDRGNLQLDAYEVYVNGELASNQSVWSATTFRQDLKSSHRPSKYSVKVYGRYRDLETLSDPVSAVFAISKNCTAGGSSSWKQFFAAKFSFLSFSQMPNPESDED